MSKKAKKAKKASKPVKKAKPVKAAAKPAKKPVKKAVPAKKAAAKKATPKKTAPAKKAVAKKAAPPKKIAAAPKADKLKKSSLKAALPVEKKSKSKKVEVIAEETVKVEVKAPIKDVVLTDAEGRILCRVKDCDQPAVVENYCRYHYLFFWKKIQNRKKILSEGKLEQYIEELTSRYPLKFLELIRKDLGSEPDFLSAIQELDIDEGNNIDEFEDENFIEEVRGIGSGADTERVDDEY